MLAELGNGNGQWAMGTGMGMGMGMGMGIVVFHVEHSAGHHRLAREPLFVHRWIHRQAASYVPPPVNTVARRTHIRL